MHFKFATLVALALAVNTIGATTFSYTPSTKRADIVGHVANPTSNKVLRSGIRPSNTNKRLSNVLGSSRRAATLDDDVLRENIREAVAKRRSDTMGRLKKKKTGLDVLRENQSGARRAVRFSA